MGRNPEKNKADLARTRARLLEAGQHVAFDKGLALIKVRDVVAHAKVAIGTFYAHFPNLESFSTAVIGDALQQLRSEVREIRGLRSGAAADDPVGHIRGSFELFFDYLDSNQGLALLLLHERHGSGPYANLIRKTFDLFSDDLAEDIGSAVKLGVISPQVWPRLASAAILGMTLEMAERYLEGLIPNRADHNNLLGANANRTGELLAREVSSRDGIINTLTRISLGGLTNSDFPF